MSGLAVKKMYFDLQDFGRVNAMPGGTLNKGGFNRAMKMSDVGPVGPTEEPVVPSVQFKIALKQNDGITLTALGDLMDQNVTITTDDGRSWLLRDAFNTAPPALSDGEVDMNLEGFSCEEIS